MSVCAVPQAVISFLSPHLLAWGLNWFLHGILTTQLYMYHRSDFQDKTWNKVLVYGIYLIETAQTILAGHDANAILAQGWGCEDRLYGVYTTDLSTNILPSITSVITQFLYAWRIYKFTQSILQCALIVTLSTVQGIFGFVAGVLQRVWNYTDDSRATHDLSWVFIVWLTGTAICDVVICALLSYHIIWKREEGRLAAESIARTQNRVDKVITVVVGTGMSSAITATLCITLFMAFKEYHYYFPPALLLSKVYSNSLLVISNNRTHYSCNPQPPAFHMKPTSQSRPSFASAETECHLG